MHLQIVRHSALVATLPLLCAALSGCGEGFQRHPISGRVVYMGQPVEYGGLVFEPDISVGQLAPTSYARIENGVYRTLPAESPTKGKYTVRVNGFDKSKMKTNLAPGEAVETPELFPQFVTTVEIPPPGGHFDIEVPSTPTPTDGDGT